MKGIFVASPIYHEVTAHYHLSTLNLFTEMVKRQIPHTYEVTVGEGYLPRAMNRLVHKFLRTDLSHLLMVHSDVGFYSEDVFKLLELDLDVCGAFISIKELDWVRLAMHIQSNPKMSPELYPIGAQRIMANFQNATIDLSKPMEMKHLGTAMTLIKREVFEKMWAEQPEWNYLPCSNEAHLGDEFHAWFHWTFSEHNRNLLSEDYHFCENWQKLGGKVYGCPWMRTVHSGTYDYLTDLVAYGKVCTPETKEEETVGADSGRT